MKPIIITDDINYQALREAVEAVEENINLNDGDWNWEDADHVASTYDIALDEQCAAVIERAIASNGESLATDLPAVELAVWGQNFAGSWWDRGRD